MRTNLNSTTLNLKCFLAILLLALVPHMADAFGVRENKGARSVTPEIMGFYPEAADQTAVQYERFEASFTLDEQFDNPYDPGLVAADAHVTTPDGSRIVVPAFWYEGRQRRIRAGREVLVPDNSPAWKVRFTPRQVGTYRYHIIIDIASRGSVRYPSSGDLTLNVLPSGDHGFLRRSDIDESCLEFEDGAPFVGIGHNLCGWEWGGTDNTLGTYEFDNWLLKLHENGANMTQFDLCEGDQIEWTGHPYELPFSSLWNGVGYYNQSTAWKLDHLVETAEALGIYFRLTLFHWEDFDNEDEGFPHWGWSRNPYNTANGGSAETVTDFFSGTEPRAAAKNYLRYVVARWGYSTSLMAYELFNEVDAEDMEWGPGRGFEEAEQHVSSWHKDMARYVRGLDGHRHLITTSYANSDNGYALWTDDATDFSTIHRYTYFNPDYGSERYSTISTISSLTADRLERTHKPVLITEFALSPAGDIQREHDPDGVAFHNQIWSSALSSSFGTAMHWNWGSYIHDNRLYHHYAPLAGFLRDADLRKTRSIALIGGREDNLNVIGRIGPSQAYLWIQDISSSFTGLQAGGMSGQINDERVAISGVTDGDYSVQFIDPYSGAIVGDGTAGAVRHRLEIAIPSFSRDIAVRVRAAEPAVSWESTDIGQSYGGSATTISGESIELKASGGGVGGLLDGFRYFCTNATEVSELSVWLDSLTNVGHDASAGIMVRGSFIPNARFLYLSATPLGELVLWQRDGGLATRTELGRLTFPFMLKVELRDGQAILSTREVGADWHVAGEQSYGTADQNLIGLAAASANSLYYATARFRVLRTQ